MMKKILFIFLYFFFIDLIWTTPTRSIASMNKNQPSAVFIIESMKNSNVDTMSINTKRVLYNAAYYLFKQYGVSEQVSRGMATQMMLESAYCTSLAGINNYSGIKSFDGTGTRVMTFEYGLSPEIIREYKRRGDYISFNGSRHIVYDRFRDFKNVNDYAEFKVHLLSNGRYAKVGVMSSLTPHEYFLRVKLAGYATAPDYVAALDATLYYLDSNAGVYYTNADSLKYNTINWKTGRRLLISLPVYKRGRFKNRL